MGRRYLRTYEEQGLEFNYFKNKCIRKGYAKSFDQELYDELDLKIGDTTVGEMIEDSETQCRCYFYALLLAKSLKGSTLVHGVLHKLDVSVKHKYYEEFEHAWVEKDGYVYDTTAKMRFSKDVYYTKMQVEKKASYTHDELAKNTTFVKLGNHAVALRPVLKDRWTKICRLWKIPMQRDQEKSEIVNNEKEMEK